MIRTKDLAPDTDTPAHTVPWVSVPFAQKIPR